MDITNYVEVMKKFMVAVYNNDLGRALNQAREYQQRED
jgi:hypothetical protein